MFCIGEIVSVYNNKTKQFELAKLLDIRHDVNCCEGTNAEHVHDILYDVKFLNDNRISKGHLHINKIKE